MTSGYICMDQVRFGFVLVDSPCFLSEQLLYAQEH